MPDFFGSRFSSNALKIGASIIIFIFLIPYTASLYNGLSRLFQMAFNVPFEYCILAMGILTAIFVVAGGYVASVVNNFIQGMIMLIGIVLIIAIVLKNNGGFIAALDGMASVSGTGVRENVPGVFASFFGPRPLDLLGVVILTSLGTWGLPQMVGRFYSIKNENMITKGAIVSTIFALFIAGGSYFLGSFGRLYESKLIENRAINPNGAVAFDAIIPTILSGMGDVMIGFVIVLVFAASISTLASLVMASASTLTLDFLKGNIVKKMNEKNQLAVIRILIVVFIAISSAIAIIQVNSRITFIAQLMGISWGALAGSFLAPFLYGLYWKKVNKISVWCCFIFSTCLMTLNVLSTNFFPTLFPVILRSPIKAGAFAMLAGLVIVPVVSFITKAPDKTAVQNCFSCYDEVVSVKVSDALGNK